jgi:hypothetical protein
MKINGTLHCHGGWTDCTTGRFDIERYQRDIQKLADDAIAKGLQLVALTDISGKDPTGEIKKGTPFVREIYRPLVNQEYGKPEEDRYDIQVGETSTVLTRKTDKRQIVFARTLEVLAEDSHVLIVGTSANIEGNQPLEKVIGEAYKSGGYAIADHALYPYKMGKGMGEKNVKKFRKKGQLLAVEENANIAWPFEWTGHYNKKVKELGKKLDMPVIANCDGNSIGQMGRMYTEYEIPEGTPAEQWYDAVIDTISSANYSDTRIQRHGKSKGFISLVRHLIFGLYSQFRARKGWIKQGLPSC